MAAPASKFCTSCGATLTPGARFCGQCGAPAAAAASATPQAVEGERRQATILFCDLTGFTRLSGTLDPEETHALLARYFEVVDVLIRDYGGAVDKHIGDAVMGVFGAPIAHGNDPERAVRAALDIHTGIAALGRELGQALQVHIGIASGAVVAAGLGSATHSEYTVTGDAVNLAARLVELAGPGHTLIADSVRTALSAQMDAVDAGVAEVKGFARPVRVFRVHGFTAEAADAAHPPLVGRVTELRQFEGALATIRESGRGQVIYLRGEAGIGKSRLVEEFMTLAERHGFARHKGLVLDFGTGKGRDAIGAILRSLLGLSPDADEPARRAAADAAARGGAVDEDHLAFLYDVLDLPQPIALRALFDAMDAAARSRGRQAMLARLVDRLSRRRPMLVAVEDLHWADRPTLGLVAALAAAAAEAPIALVMTSRIEGDPVDPAWRSAAGGVPFQTLDLGPLREAEARLLAVDAGTARAGFITACIARAGGNPLFLVQLLRAAEQATPEAVPDSIQSLVLARLDRLPPADKRALQAAAVIGQRFELATLRALLDDGTYACDALIRAYLVRPEGEDFLFVHALIRDGVYGALLRQTRRDLHRQAAAWFHDRDLVLAAVHLDRAEDPSAPQAYLRAAESLRERYDFERAAALAARGLELAKDAGDRFALAFLHAEALREVGRTQDSMAAFRRVLELARDDAERCHAWIGIAGGLRVLSRLDEAMSALDEAERALGALDLPGARGHIHFIRGNLRFARGEPKLCQAEHELALAASRATGDAELEARALGGLGDAAYASGRMATALDYFRRCSELCRARGFGRIDVTMRFMIGHCLRYQNDLRGALVQLEQGIAASTLVGNRLALMNCQQSAGLMLTELGRLAEALAISDQARALAREVGARRYEGIILLYRAAALYRLGRAAEARAAAEEALAISRETSMGFIGPAALGARALIADAPAVASASLAEGEEILKRGCVGHNYFWFYRDAIETSLKARSWDEALRYAQALADYTAAEPLPWSDFYIARARALVAFGRGERGPSLCAELTRLRDEAARVGLAGALPALEAALATV